MESEILCIYLLWKVRFYVFYLFIMESEIHYGNTKLVQCFKINIILWRKKYVNIAIYIIISINEEKFGKIHLPFMKKILSKLGIERNLKKISTKKPCGEKLEIFPLRLWARQECCISPLLFNNALQVLINAVRQEMEMEIKLYTLGMKIWNCIVLRMTCFSIYKI